MSNPYGLNGTQLHQLRALCDAKAESTGLSDPAQILRAALEALYVDPTDGRNLGQRLSDRPAVRAAINLARADQHKRKRTEYSTRRKARKLGATVEPINRAEIIERDKSICYLCGIHCPPHALHLDHVIPLSRGGTHTKENLRVACPRCNIAKGNRILLPSEPPMEVPTG